MRAEVHLVFQNLQVRFSLTGDGLANVQVTSNNANSSACTAAAKTVPELFAWAPDFAAFEGPHTGAFVHGT